MFLFNYFVVLITIWIIIFFICLPIAITHNEIPIAGQELGAPDKHYFGLKTLISFGLSIVITLIYAFCIQKI